ncbi:hypothetical protein P3T76_004066 [Phytophthora citrophthora]|uniref:Uncharacterized protein n=1 Tax=Phytophthora citrophthora TaxID=4793 RepID=A0AAD9LRI2_9STRA|nr:hypothetical protein P3T76_004066 [Phytophthora citrophthora]
MPSGWLVDKLAKRLHVESRIAASIAGNAPRTSRGRHGGAYCSAHRTGSDFGACRQPPDAYRKL